jgi:hypothetical protein
MQALPYERGIAFLTTRRSQCCSNGKGEVNIILLPIPILDCPVTAAHNRQLALGNRQYLGVDHKTEAWFNRAVNLSHPRNANPPRTTWVGGFEVQNPPAPLCCE